MKISMLRFLPVALILIATAVFLQAHTRGEVFPARQKLASFPQELVGMNSKDDEIAKESLDVLHPTDYLLRTYYNGQDIPVDLFIAFFASQRTGDTIHSPKNCLPGNGWAPVHSSRIELAFAGHAPFPVTRYVIAKGDSRSLVLYWYWAHDRGVANEYWAKYYLITDSMRMNRSDGSLVRITTSMEPDESIESAQQRLMPLTNAVLPLLNDYIPR